MRPRRDQAVAAKAASRSSRSSDCVASIAERVASSMVKPLAKRQAPPASITTGNEKIRPSLTPKGLPSLLTAMLTTRPSEPMTQSRMWSQMADAALAAELAPRAAMTSLPRCWTPGTSSSLTHRSPPSPRRAATVSTARPSSTVANVTIGTWVAEWLPQITALRIMETGTPILAASMPAMRFWSSRVSAVKLRLGRDGALRMHSSAFVLAGLPTTTTLQSRDATSSRTAPWALKMPAFAASRSFRSIPGPRGRAPTRSATSASMNASSGSVVQVQRNTNGEATSCSSMPTARSLSLAASMSSNRRSTARSPNTPPRAIINTSE
mmetsp:Transcript_19821/g.76072  ORF Transcript_19821/g.76072 Transcript_19821/m.76072 type:complete len:323 (+) Transcript_19821:1339-2307(+)